MRKGKGFELKKWWGLVQTASLPPITWYNFVQDLYQPPISEVWFVWRKLTKVFQFYLDLLQCDLMLQDTLQLIVGSPQANSKASLTLQKNLAGFCNSQDF